MMTHEQALRIQRELLPISKGIPNGDPYLTDGVWVLPYLRGTTAVNVFLVDRNISSESAHARAKREGVEKFKRAIGG